MTTAAAPEPLASDGVRAGREAFGRHAWQEAFELLGAADRDEELSGDDLEVLSEASFFAARPDVQLDAKERAFKAHLANDDQLRAAYVALDVATAYGRLGKSSIASAWTRRAERLLEGMDETYVHGFLALIRSDAAREAGNIEAALEFADQAVRIATTAGNPDLQAYALSELGTLKIATGLTADGFALMEEATISAVNGELSPLTTGITCCRLIAACRDLTDYRRASEWTEATERYCERESVAAFPGICRVHRAEVVAVSGAWERAELELEQATGELAAYNAIPPLADGLYALGDIKRLRGDIEGAEVSLRSAHAYGRTPHPALALIRLSQGKVKAAAAAINSAVGEETWNQWAKARLLPAQVEIAIEAGDPGLARAAAEELGRIVDTYTSPAMEAGRHHVLGQVLFAEGDAAGAVRELRSAIRYWREVNAPYEVARSRSALAGALRAIDDDDEADLELQTALTEFERLGAKPAAEAARRDLRTAEDRRSRPVQVRKTFMFTDIVGSTNLAEMLGNDVWEQVLRRHDDTLRGLIAGGGGAIVNSTGDGFFVAFDSARQAIDCARSIQQTLIGQGSLAVRIGLHSAQATRRGDDYSGIGVHLAARVAALATGGEILATAETLAEAGEPASDPRAATLKGLTAPVAIAAIKV